MNVMTEHKDHDKRFITIEQLEDALEERQLPDRRREDREKSQKLMAEHRKEDRRSDEKD